jgi:hypothetical protein
VNYEWLKSRGHWLFDLPSIVVRSSLIVKYSYAPWMGKMGNKPIPTSLHSMTFSFLVRIDRRLLSRIALFSFLFFTVFLSLSPSPSGFTRCSATKSMFSGFRHFFIFFAKACSSCLSATTGSELGQSPLTDPNTSLPCPKPSSAAP